VGVRNESLGIDAELVRRHQAAARIVLGLIIATILLSIVAFLIKGHLRQQDNSFLNMALRITIAVCGLGSVALRRTRFATLRLQDIAALEGISGLLKTLEKTTLQVAFLAASIAGLGFVSTLATGNDFYTYGGGLVAIGVLLYCYPTRTSWQRALIQFAPERRTPSEQNSAS
jgi:hypothetical protein